MSAAQQYIEKCRKRIQENIKLTLEKLSDPSSFIQVDISGVLKDAASGNFGPLKNFATDYISNNADTLLLEALKVTGTEKSVLDALNLYYNMMAQAFSAYNDLVLYYLKKLAMNIVHEIEQKEKVNADVKQKLINLYNGLKAYSSGDPAFDKYLKTLRSALVELNSGATDINLVRNTLARNGRFLGKKYRQGKSKVEEAVDLIKPIADNPYLNSNTKEILHGLGVPTEKEQITNLLAIPVLCREVIKATNDYGARTTKINAMLTAYYAGLAALQTGLPPILSKYVISRFDSTLGKLDDLIASMALQLNGSESSISNTVSGFKPNATQVSTHAFKWAMDGSLIKESFKLIPTGNVIVEKQKNGFVLGKNSGFSNVLTVPRADHFKKVKEGDAVEIFSSQGKGIYRVKKVSSDFTQLTLDRIINLTASQYSEVEYEVTSDAMGSFELSLGPVDAYSKSVTQLKALGSISAGSTALIATEARENYLIYGQQLNSFLIDATVSITSAKITPASLSLCQGFIKRCDLVTSRDKEIVAKLTTFINTPIPLEDTLKKIHEGLTQALKALGLDRASDLMANGDFAKFFKLNSKTATYVGAALEAIAFLRDCFPDTASAAKFSERESELKGDQELLNFKISFNFDLAIFKNLQDCLNFNAIAQDFLSKEFLCGLLEDAGVGKIFNKLNDILSF